MSTEPTFPMNCPKCGRTTTGTVHGKWLDVDREDPGYAHQHTLASCPSCDQVVLFKHTSEPYDDPHGPPRWWDEPEILYPARVGLPETVPAAIRRSFAEATVVFASGSHTAAAIMCRRTLEGICVHFDANGKSLTEKLRRLKEEGKITDKVFEWADEALRPLGNNAAHDVNVKIEKEDSTAALEFTRAIIEYLFVFEAAFQDFKERERKRHQATKTAASNAK